MSGGGGDVGPSGEAEQADGGVPQGGHDRWCVAGTDLGAVFIESDISDPVQPVFDTPVLLDPTGQDRWWRVVVVSGGDDVDDLHALLACLGAGAPDLRDLFRAGEVDPVRGVHDFDGAGHGSAVGPGAGGVGGYVRPGQLRARGVQPWLVLLDGEDVVAAGFGDHLGGVVLGVHRIHCDDRVLDVHAGQQGPDRWYLVALFAATVSWPRTAPVP